MRQFNKFRGTKGFITVWERVIRFKYMITEEAKERCRILAFWEKHGTDATMEAFKVSKRTLFRWQENLEKTFGKLEGLNRGNTAPKKRNKRIVPIPLSDRIIELRTLHPRIGKEKIHALLKAKGYEGSISTVGRILTDLKLRGSLPNPRRVSLSGKTGNLITPGIKPYRKKLRRPKGYRVLEVDTVVRFVDGVKRYIVTGIDTEKRTAFAALYTNHGSASASDFLTKCQAVLPDCPDAVQTDNGSEFALHFDRACDKMKLKRFHTYPRSPKMNAHVERFNRTLDEEFLKQKRSLMRDDPKAFNDALVDWLLWYNGERPHHSLGLRSPFQAMMDLLKAQECHMWWTNTHT